MVKEIDPISTELERSAKIAPEGIIHSIVVDEKPVRFSIKNSDTEDLGETLTTLRNNDHKIVSFLLQSSGSYRYAFNGLVRQLKIHPQSLARSLRRLMELGIIQKSNDGYKLRALGVSPRLTSEMYDEKTILHDGIDGNFIKLIQAQIPFPSANDEIVRNLIGKRFGKLCWLGLVEGKDEYYLQRISNESSILVVVCMVSCYITLETNALTDRDKVEAMVGGCRIFGRVLGIINTDSVAYSMYPFDCSGRAASRQWY